MPRADQPDSGDPGRMLSGLAAMGIETASKARRGDTVCTSEKTVRLRGQRHGEPVTHAIDSWNASYDEIPCSAFPRSGRKLPTRPAELSSASPISAATRSISPMPFPSRGQSRQPDAFRARRGRLWFNHRPTPPAGRCTRCGILGEWHSHPAYATRARATPTSPSSPIWAASSRRRVARPHGHRSPLGDFSLLSFDPSLCRGGRSHPQGRHPPWARLSFGYGRSDRTQNRIGTLRRRFPEQWHSISVA